MAGDTDIWVLPPDGSPAPFFTSEANESHATFSPDGRWLAYVSDQSGRFEVYVRPYPGPGASDADLRRRWSESGLVGRVEPGRRGGRSGLFCCLPVSFGSALLA